MAHIAGEYAITFEEFAEARKAHQRRKRFLSEEPDQSPKVGCAWIAGLFALVLVSLVVVYNKTGHTFTGADGRTWFESTSPVVTFLTEFLSWVGAVGCFWFIIVRAPVGRRIAGPVMILFLLFGATYSLVTALTDSGTPANTPPPGGNQWLLSLLPWVVLIIGMLLLVKRLVRRVVRVAWDGQPHLCDLHRLDASDERMAVGTPLMRIEYSWPAFLSYAETDNLFVLFFSALGYQIIPKRAFATTTDVDAFRELLSLKVPNDKPRPRGFEVKVLPPTAASAESVPVK